MAKRYSETANVAYRTCNNCTPKGTTIMSNSCRPRYTFGNFLLDSFLFIVTGGLWLIWIIVREIRNN